MQRLYTFAIFLVLIVVPLSFVDAAHIYIDTENNEYNNLDTFYIPVRLDVKKNECVNAVKVSILYNPSEISMRDVSVADSILTLWTQKPVIKEQDGVELGMVSFEGGIPGGYCGRVTGDPGKTDTLVKLVVTGVVGENDKDNFAKLTHITIDPNTKVYLNNGFGSEADLTFAGIDLILKNSTTTPNNVWLSDIKSDTIAPELFEITLIKGPSEGNKKSYIIFNTTDKQSGVDHYEVLETDPDRFGFLSLFPNKESRWVVADSPYVLRDQKLQSKIMVKAVDKNGNERIAEYVPDISIYAMVTTPNIFVPVAGILFIVFIIFIFIFRKIKRKKKLNELAEVEKKDEENKIYE